MSTFVVTAEKLTIFPHPDAERLELAAVGGYRAVVLKDQYVSGDFAVYIPEQGLLPPELIDELGLGDKLAGSKHNRVKTVRLCGELSQGIVCSPKVLADEDMVAAERDRTDFAERLGITKWEPEIPAHMQGQLIPAMTLVPWIEIENIKRYPTMFEPGEPVLGSEKIHGTATCISIDVINDAFMVASKGFSNKRLSLVEDEANLYWRAVRVHDIESKMRAIAGRLGVTRFALFGETYGAGIQDLTYGVASRNKPGFAVFDAWAEMPGEAGRWLDQAELRNLTNEFGVHMVPTLYEGPYDYVSICAAAEGQTIEGAGANIREGVVVRPLHERISPLTGGRTIAKFVSPAYLLRKGEATEFE